MCKRSWASRKFQRFPKTRLRQGRVINLRGKVIPVIDLRLEFGMEPQSYTVPPDSTPTSSTSCSAAERGRLLDAALDGPG